MIRIINSVNMTIRKAYMDRTIMEIVFIINLYDSRS
jgi:hypothetical protein